MAHLHGVRFSAWCFGLVLAVAALFPLPAAASVHTEYCTNFRYGCGVDLGWFLSKADACAADYQAGKAATSPLMSYRLDWADPACRYCVAGVSGYCTDVNHYSERGYGTRQAGSPDASSCDVLKDRSAGTFTWPGGASPTYICDLTMQSGNASKPGCLLVASSTIVVTYSGQVESNGPGSYTGAACAGASDGNGMGVDETNPRSSTDTGVPGSTTAVKTTCTGFLGTINGVTTCVPASGSNGMTSTVVTSGTVTTPTGTEVDGTKTVTTCDGVKCTSTTTRTVTANGTTTSTITATTQPISDYCKQNPTAPQCGGVGTGTGSGSGTGTSTAGTFSGDCVADFVCTGDAVQCATAKAVNEQKCIFSKSSTENDLYVSTVAGGTGNTGLGSSTVSLSSASFSQETFLGAASCAADLPITVMGTTMTLPMSRVCPALSMLGNLLIAVSFLLAIRIVGRG